MGATLQLLAPVLVTLALKIDSLVGSEQAPNSLALVTGTGSLPAMVANPFFGKLSDRTSSPWGMRRPWMIIGLTGGALGILVVDGTTEDFVLSASIVYDPGSSTSPTRSPSPSRRPSRRPSSRVGSGSYGVLYAVAGVCALTAAVAILPLKRVR